MTFSRMLGLAASATALLAGLTACSPVVSLEPAANANDPLCASVTVSLPDNIDGLNYRSTDAQASAAWGEPASVLFRCGLEPVKVSTLHCVTASGVDWLVDESNKPNYRFITFARTPAAEVIIDSTKVSGINALDALAPSLKALPVSDHCTSAN
ncbi:MAG: DUF3515 family protein [Micrococcales bacterium]